MKMINYHHTQASIYVSDNSTVYLGPVGMASVISELCYKGTILQRNLKKFHADKLREPQVDPVISKSVL